MDKLKMQTPNKADENFKKLAAMFPNAVTETIDENGEVVRAIDKDVLMQEINTRVVDGKEERYQFTWPDKKKSVLLANAPISKTLRPCREESVDFDTTENLYIEGDNLEVLKLLQETYLGKIKMIYIDPPYNTGNDFVYEDDFAQSTDEYLANSGQFDEEGNRLVANTESNGRFHTDWLNMIYPRLKLAKDLLSEDGVIFISIDDGEQENLKKMCNEIFGKGNFIAQFIWEKTVNPNMTYNNVGTVHEYILCYSKSMIKLNLLKLSEEETKDYTERDEYINSRGPYKLVGLNKTGTVTDLRPNLMFDIIAPDNSVIKPKPRWRWSKEKFNKGVKEGRIVFNKSSTGWSVYYKQYLYEDTEGNKVERGSLIKTIFSNVGRTTNGSNEISSLLGKGFFDFPKPVELIKHLVKIATPFSAAVSKNEDVSRRRAQHYGTPDNKTATFPQADAVSDSYSLAPIPSHIILDFFSGSATTAHAVMQLNTEDGGNRKFIMVQLPEETDEKSEAYKAGYKNICEIGKERIRRAGDQILELRLESLEKEGVIEKLELSKEKLEKDAGKLSKTRSLEEIYGLSGNGVSTGEETSTGGNLRTVRPNEKSGGVDSVEHCGGAVKGKEGIYPIFENSKGFTSRTGDTIVDLRTLEVLNRFGYRINFEYIRGNQQNDLFADSESKLQTLRAKLSFLRSDHGFRVLKIDTSNMKDVFYRPDEVEQDMFDNYANNIKSDRTAEDLLFQTMLDLGIMLSSKIETKIICKKEVFCVEGNYLMACFDKDVTEDVITEIAKQNPYYFVMRDPSDAQDGDSLITNFEQIFATYSPNTQRKIL